MRHILTADCNLDASTPSAKVDQCHKRIQVFIYPILEDNMLHRAWSRLLKKIILIYIYKLSHTKSFHITDQNI